MCLSLHSSWVKIPWFVERTRCPNCLEGRILLVHFSKSGSKISYLGEITPHLLIRPINSITIFLLLWSSIIQNSPMQLCFCMILKNFSRTLETGLRRTCFLPLRSALTIVLRASARILIFTIESTIKINNIKIQNNICLKFRPFFVIENVQKSQISQQNFKLFTIILNRINQIATALRKVLN